MPRMLYGRQLDMDHIIHDCPLFEEERHDAITYTKADRFGRKSWANTDLYINFCAMAQAKITATVKEAKRTRLDQMDNRLITIPGNDGGTRSQPQEI